MLYLVPREVEGMLEVIFEGLECSSIDKKDKKIHRLFSWEFLHMHAVIFGISSTSIRNQLLDIEVLSKSMVIW